MGIFGGKKKKAQPLCAAVVVAAGNSTRMGEDKIMLTLGVDPVIVHTIRALEKSVLISEIVVVTREDLLLPVANLCQEYGFTKVSKVIRGGESRTESVFRGVNEVTCGSRLIAIHDGARPFVPLEVVDETIEQAAKNGAAAPAIPLKDTVKEAVNSMIEKTIDRSSLYAVQTPQVFDSDLICAALQKALDDKAEITDDCSAVERLGMKVVLTKGAEMNFKLTTKGDLLLARGLVALLEDKK